MGKFIVFSGLDASGKSTNRDIVASRLKESGSIYGRDFILTREPGGTPYAERIRELILDNQYDSPPLTELLLFYAARVDHTQNVIIPTLENGVHVLCDRYYDSSLAYQSIQCEETFAVHNACREKLRVPDMTLLFDIPVDTAMARMQKSRGVSMDKIELRGVEYFEQVRENFLNMAKDDRNSIIINADRDLESVSDEVWYHVKRFIS